MTERNTEYGFVGPLYPSSGSRPNVEVGTWLGLTVWQGKDFTEAGFPDVEVGSSVVVVLNIGPDGKTRSLCYQPIGTNNHKEIDLKDFFRSQATRNDVFSEARELLCTEPVL